MGYNPIDYLYRLLASRFPIMYVHRTARAVTNILRRQRCTARPHLALSTINYSTLSAWTKLPALTSFSDVHPNQRSALFPPSQLSRRINSSFFSTTTTATTTKSGSLSTAASDNEDNVDNSSDTTVTNLAQGLTRLSLCLPPETFHDLIDVGGIQLTVDGMEYRLTASPMGSTQDVIDVLKRDIASLEQKVIVLSNQKKEIDDRATTFTKRIVVGALAYLVAQATVVAKLTFASRLGWDIMEPITYLVTFMTAVFGLGYFSVSRKDYMYETVWDQLQEKRQKSLYLKDNFDLINYEAMLDELAKKEERLARMIVM